MIKFLQDKNNRDFLRLWCAQLISQFGDRLNQMALIGLIAQRAPGSALGLAKLLAFTIIPVFIIGPVAGVYVDRWDRRRTLFICDILRGLLVLTIPWIFMQQDSMVPIYIVVFLAFCCSRFYVPAKMSIIPDLVAEENLLIANSLMTTTGMIAFVLGCALGGFLVEWFGARGGLVGDAVTFFVSGLLIFSIKKDFHFTLDHRKVVEKGRKILKVEKSLMLEVKEGLAYLVNNPDIWFVVNMLFIVLAAAGAIYVAIIVFVQQAFHSVTKDLGVLAVFLGIGLFCGSLLYGRWGKKFAWYNVIFGCLILGGGMIIIFAWFVHHYPHIITASILSLLLGTIIGPIFIASNTVVHLVSDENMRGKVFSALEIVIHFAFLVSMLFSSFLAKYVDRIWILIGVGITFAVVGVVGAWRYRKSPPHIQPIVKA